MAKMMAITLIEVAKVSIALPLKNPNSKWIILKRAPMNVRPKPIKSKMIGIINVLRFIKTNS